MAGRRGFLLVWTAVVAAAGDARAFDFDRLLMPGPVIAAHERWEGKCSECHRPLDRGTQDELCLGCHEEERTDLAKGLGFHGHSEAVRSAEACRTCHPEHRGRDADVVGLLPEIFDHHETDYPLTGAHASAPCAACHPAGRSHRDAPHDCAACHREDDVHHGSLGSDCADCHTPSRWPDASFDHDGTKFPLRGAHGSVRCALCHPGPEAVPTDCVGCHRLDDVHRRTLGTDCGSCHGVDRWSSPSFDHGRDTRFPLDGRHARVACVACHSGPPNANETVRSCASCHGSQDVHAGRNGSECGTCHGADSWQNVLFDHDRDTRFALAGAHATLRCAQCHGTRLDGLPRDPACVDCHRGDDVHGGSLSTRCDSCHQTSAWSRPIVFEHDVTRFPLLGLHATVSCEQCHVSRSFDRVEPSCKSCHAGEDAHEGGLGDDCGRCHGPNGWALWDFDHGKETSFELHGAHEDLACSACHPGNGSRSTTSVGRCVFCHADDDAHFGAFGQSCEQCHSDESWNLVRPRR